MTEFEKQVLSKLEEISGRLARIEQGAPCSEGDPFAAKAWARGKLIELQKRRENRKKRGHGSETPRD